LQYACAVGNQNVVDFLIENGADPSIKDATGRTAQEISYLLNLSCIVPSKLNVKRVPENEKSINERFHEFIQDPMNYLFKLDEKMDEILEFQRIYDFHSKGKTNPHLNELLNNQIKTGKFNYLFDDSFFRTNSKSEFFKTIKNEKVKNSWPKEVKKLFTQLDEKFDEENQMNQEELDSLVMEKLYSDWVSEKSPVMKQLDSMIDFKIVNEKIKIKMLERVKEVKEPGILFPEIEKAFKILDSFQTMKYETEFDLFSQMNTKVEEVKMENQELKKEIQEMKLEIENLKSIILMKTLHPDIPHDALFIGSDQ
jgi:hypothetical protein